MRLKALALILCVLFGHFATAGFAGDPWKFDEAVLTRKARNYDKPLVVVVSASWCKPCKLMKQDIDKLDTSNVYYTRVDYQSKFAKVRNVQSLPTVFVIAKDPKTGKSTSKRYQGRQTLETLKKIFRVPSKRFERPRGCH